MTPETPYSIERRLTVDDVRHHAEEVRDMAISQAKQFRDEQGTRAVIIGVVAVVGIVSIAYYLGTRAARSDYGG